MALPVLVNLGCGNAWHAAWQNYDLLPCPPSVSAIDLSQPLPFADSSVDAIYHAHVLEHLEPAAASRLLAECHRVLRPGGILRVVVPDLALHARNYLGALERGDPVEHEWTVIQLIDQLVRTRSEGAMGDFLRRAPWRNHPRIAPWISPEIGVPPTAGKRRFSTILTRLRHACASLWLTRQERGLLQEIRFRSSGETHRWMYDRFSLERLLQGNGFARVQVCEAAVSGIDKFAGYRLDVTPDGSIRHPDSLYMEARKG